MDLPKKIPSEDHRHYDYEQVKLLQKSSKLWTFSFENVVNCLGKYKKFIMDYAIGFLIVN